MRLDPAAAAVGFRLAVHQTLASTNAEALAAARDRRGETSPLWVTAQEQTAGRGRRGNAWISPPGNLYATLLLTDPALPPHAPELSFVAALAVHDAIAGRAPGLREKLALKWPNDVLCGGSKLAGILIESHNLDARLAVAIGIGVNCRHHPSQTSYPATDLAAAGVEVSADDLFVALSAAMMQRLDQWRRGEGFMAIRSDWLARATGIGGEMRVRLPGRELLGRCEALDESGRLLLRLADGTLETIAAGDIFPVVGNESATRTPQKGHVS
jgi:BirA family transcriptional regulator, biotin operon repressor / biotin---[acetyl-CoA-carboxylase] ligase